MLDLDVSVEVNTFVMKDEIEDPTYAEVVKEGDIYDSRDSDSGSKTLDSQATTDAPRTIKKCPSETPDTTDTTPINGGDEKSYAAVLKDGVDQTTGEDEVKRDKTASESGVVNSRNGHTSHNGAVKDKPEYDSTTQRKQKPQRNWGASDDAEDDKEWERTYGYQAAGIRFAPWNVPLKRRLQTLAVLGHSLSIASLVSVFFFLCAIPLTWPLLIPYLIHVLVSNAASDGKLRFRSERFRRHRAWKLFAGYYPATLHKTHDLPATRKYIFGYHPHGIISHGAWAAFATEALGFADKFPGLTNSLLTLDSNFRIPIYRDYILAMGLRSVSKESIGNILTRGGPNDEGMGRAVTIVVGGARESLEAQPGRMRLILKERKGFIKLAVRTGADLVPVLAFGENDLYDQMNPNSHPWLHNLQMFVLRVWKFTLPFLHGRGIFNYDVGLMPYRRPLHIVVGKPIKVAQATGGIIDTAEVDRLHGEYVEELHQIWDTYKDVFAKGRKEELKILK